MPPKQMIKGKRQLMEEAKKGREARKKLRLSMMSPVAEKAPGGPSPMPAPSDSSMILPPGLGQDMDTSLAMGIGGPGTSALGFGASAVIPTAGSARGRPEEILKTFSEQWKMTLDQEDLKSLALFLCHIFTTELKMSPSKAAERTSKIIGKTDRTIRQWRSDLLTYGEIRESKKGKYQRPKVLWANKELNDKARAFVQANTAFLVQGKPPTMKVKDFCQWVNETLLPNQAVASLYSFVPGYGYAPAPSSANQTPLPQKISLETARKWLRELGF